MMPIPEFTNGETVFGARANAFVDSREGSELQRKFQKEARAASALFFKGGKLAEQGFKLKAGVDSAKAHRALRALLCSFEPSHEAKIGTVAQYLNAWCDPCDAETEKTKEPQQKPRVQRASKKWRKKR